MSGLLTELLGPDVKSVSFQLPTTRTDESHGGRPEWRPFHKVFLRLERRPDAADRERYPFGKDPETGRLPPFNDRTWEPCWYVIKNGWSAGYLSDAQAFDIYVNSGVQLELGATA